MASKDGVPSREPVDRCREALYTPMAVRAALQLGVFTGLADRPMTAAALAEAMGVAPRRLAMLLYQLVLAEFLELDGDVFANTAMSDHYLVAGRPGYIGGIHELWTDQWANMFRMAEGIRTDTPQAKIDYDAMSTEDLRTFLRGLHGTSISAGRALAGRFDFSGPRRVVDIGGGSAGMLIALCEDNPELSATLVELPRIAAIARAFIAEAGLEGRIAVATADILAAPVPGTFDIALAKSVFQTMSEDDAGTAIRNVGAAPPPGGMLHIVGFICDDSRLSPASCVGMNLVFINMFDDGEVYTEGRYRAWLTDAGFADIGRQPFPGGYSLMSARKA